MEPDFLCHGGPAEGARADAGPAIEATANVAARQEDHVALQQRFRQEGDSNIISMVQNQYLIGMPVTHNEMGCSFLL